MTQNAANADAANEPFNAGAQQGAAIYAKALLGATEKAGTTEAVLDELEVVVRDVLGKHPELEKILSSAFLSGDDKLALLDRTFGGRLSPTTLDFLKILSSHGRLELVRVVLKAARERYDQLRGRVPVEVATAAPLSSAELEKLKTSLWARVGGEPLLRAVVRPELIGGVVLRIGDSVYDGSVARQLEQLREQMIHRSVHEIQSRRDRFRHSG